MISDAKEEVLRLVVLQVSFDETTQEVRNNVSGDQSLLMMSGKFVYLVGSRRIEGDIIVPTTILTEGCAEALLAALELRVPELFVEYKCRLVVILNSDSHKACMRLARHFYSVAQNSKMPGITVLHSRCMQHMANAALVYTTNPFKLLNGCFCSTVQMHKGQTMRQLKDQTRVLIDRFLVIEYEAKEQWLDNVPRNRSFVKFLFQSMNVNLDGTSSRHRAADNLISWLPALWCKSPKLVHWCPPGCCRSRPEAVEKIANAFEDLLLSQMPRIPSVSRWTKLMQPFAWWAFAFAFFRLIRTAFASLVPHEDTENLFLAVSTLFGAEHSSNDVHKAKERTRWKKAIQWMQKQYAADHLLLLVLLMEPALMVMNRIFEGEETNLNAVTFASRRVSPSMTAVNTLLKVVTDTTEEFWFPWETKTSWAPDARLLAQTSALRLAGNLFMRCVAPFEKWPWKAARIVNPMESEEVRRNTIDDLERARPECCLDAGFGQQLQPLLRDDDTGENFLTVLYEAFTMCPMSNVPTENRFASCRNHALPSRGRIPMSTTLASKHVLSEAMRLHK